MTIGQGFDAILARKVGATWGTPVSVNSANTVLPFLSESISPVVNQIEDDALYGTAFRRPSETGAKTASGNIETYMRYDGLEVDIAMCMGRALTSPSKKGATPPAYLNNYTLKDNLSGYFVTMCIDKQVAIHEWASVKYNGMTISGKAGDRLRIAFDLIATKLNLASATNSTLSSATERAPRKYILFEHCRFLMKAQSGTVLTPGVDDIYPSEFTLQLNNNLAGEITAENDPYIDEPLRTNFGEVTGTMTIPKYKGTAVETAFLNGTSQKMSIRCISSTQICAPGSGAYYYAFNMFLPEVKITEASRPVSGAGQIPATFNFKAYTPASAPDGMDGVGSSLTSDKESRNAVTGALAIETTSVFKSNALA